MMLGLKNILTLASLYFLLQIHEFKNFVPVILFYSKIPCRNFIWRMIINTCQKCRRHPFFPCMIPKCFSERMAAHFMTEQTFFCCFWYYAKCLNPTDRLISGFLTKKNKLFHHLTQFSFLRNYIFKKRSKCFF